MARLFLALALAPALLGDQPPGPSQCQELTLRQYNYAKLHPHVLREARREAARLFENFGVKPHWLLCPTSPSEMQSNRECADELAPSDLVLNLLPPSMSKKYGFKNGIFGFALPTAKGAPGNHISLFVARVTDLAYHGSVGTTLQDAQAIILGHMIAHEIGHLLLGPNSHSSKGLMRFPWTKKVLQEMERGRLNFTIDEQSKIRLEMARRAAIGVQPMKAW